MQLQVLISFFFAYISAVQAAPIELPVNGLIGTLSIAAREVAVPELALAGKPDSILGSPTLGALLNGQPLPASGLIPKMPSIPILGQVLGGGSLLGRQVDASENALLSAIDLSPPFEANKALPSKPTTFRVTNANGELDSVLAPRKIPREMLAPGLTSVKLPSLGLKL